MHKIALFTLLILGFSITAISQPGNLNVSHEKVFLDGKTFYLHIVEKGQTSWSISKAYNILVNELAEENPTVFDSLSIGQELRIPVIKGRNYNADEIKFADSFLYHYIEKGQTAYSVSRIYEYDTETLFKWNSEAKSGFIPGQLIRLPKKGTDINEIAFMLETKQVADQIIVGPEPNFIYHKVEKGNTLYSISKMYDEDQAEIVKLNPGCDKVLSLGTLLKVKRIPKLITTPVDNKTVNSDEELKSASEEVVTNDIKIADENINTLNSKLNTKNTSKVVKINIVGHTIRKGESLYSIAIKYNISKGDIIKYNKGITSILTIGDKLLIPQAHLHNSIDYEEIIEKADVFLREDKRYYYHKVEKGESLSDIARFYLIKTRRIKKGNSFMKKRDIVEGDIIWIPKRYIRDIQLVSRMVKEKYSKETEVEIVNQTTKDSIPVFNLGSYNYFDNQDTIKIALMLPLYLFENDTLELNDTIDVKLNDNVDESMNIDNVLDAFAEPEIKIYGKSHVFLEFYEGFLIALDSLNDMGVNLELFTYDTDRNIDTVHSILSKPELSEMDMIFGPVYEENLKLVNEFAVDKGIVVISPVMSGSNDSISNPLFYRAIPRTETQIKMFSKVISEYYHKNIVIMHYGTEKEKQNIIYYEKYLLPELYHKTDSSKVKFSVVELDKDKAFDIIKPRKDENEKDVFDHPIKNALIEDMPNLVIIPSKNRGLVSNTIRQLNTLYEEVVSDYEITIAGFASTRNYTNIDLQYLHNLEFHTFSPSYVDYSKDEVKEFVKDYRIKYKSEPSQFSFQGYDLLWFYTNSFVSYGPEFYKYNAYISVDTTIQCLQNDFSFLTILTEGVFENQHIYILKYEQNYDVIRLDEIFKYNNEINLPKLEETIEKVREEEEAQPENILRLYRRPE